MSLLLHSEILLQFFHYMKTSTKNYVVSSIEPGKPFHLLNGSIEGDLISQASHTHGLYCDDNATVYYNMEEATRGTPFDDSIKPFQRRKDDRSALEAM